MILPDRIPKWLRSIAIFLPELDEGEGAWFKADAMAVIESLQNTTVAVSDVILFDKAPWGYLKSDIGISTGRLFNEEDTDYAERSRSIAIGFIRHFEATNDQMLFVLRFPLLKDAA